MTSVIAVFAASLTTFALTNIDDMFLLTLFFAKRVPTRRIIGGQYLGFAAIILLSLLGTLGALAIPHGWIRLLGLLPIFLGIKELFLRTKDHSPQELLHSSYGTLSIATITLSNGADNVGVYVPFFVTAKHHLWLILSAYAALIAVWCFLGRWFGKHPLLLRSVERWGHWIVPLVLVVLGIYVLARR